MTHEYAYALDSNRNLSYDYTMFHKRNGSLNNNGMRLIFRDINGLIHDIKQYNAESIEINKSKHQNDNFHTQFFL